MNHVNGGGFTCETCERGVEFRCEPFEGGVNSHVNHVNGGRIHIPYHVNHVNSPPVQMVHMLTVSLPLGAVAREGCGSLELVEIFQMRIILRRFTPVWRSRCGVGVADRGRDETGSHRGFDPGA